MDPDYCQERAETCLESALSVDDGDQSAGWLYLADLWAELALTKGFGKKATDDPLGVAPIKMKRLAD